MNRTLILIKPHAVERGLTGEFLGRLERMMLKIAAIKSLMGSEDLWARFYPSTDDWYRNAGTKTLQNYKQLGLDVNEILGTSDPLAIGKLIKGWLVEHMRSGMVVAAVLEGNEAVYKVRTACGKTLPNTAAPGTIRFDYSCDSPLLANLEKRPVYNLIHASDPDEVRDGHSAVDFEIDLIFPELSNSR